MCLTLPRVGLCGVLALSLFSPVASAAPVDDARRLSQDGLAAAREGDFETALSRFMDAQDIFPHPNTLYNIGRVYYDMGNLEGALEQFNLFRSAAPESASLVEPMIQVIKARLEQQTEARISGESGGTVSASTLSRLDGLIAELDALKSELEVEAEVSAAAPPEAPPDDIAGEGFLEDAYQRQVVSASRYAQSALDSPSTISVVTRDEIEVSGVTNVPDLLRRVAGVEVMSLSAAQPDVSIRGFNQEMSNKVLVLVDGRTIYWDLWGTALWATLDVSLVDIERVEVIRGPAAALYGANAMTGVINIITRDTSEPHRLLRTEVGSPGYTQHSLLFSGRVDRTSYRVSAGYHQTGRWSMEHPVADSDQAWLVDEDPSEALRAVRANARIDQRVLDKGLLSMQGGYNEGTTHFYPWGALGRYSLPYSTGYARADAGYAGFHFRTYYNTIRAAGPYPTFPGGKPVDEPLESDVLDIELTTDQEFSTGAIEHHLTAGLGYRYKGVVWGYLAGDGQRINEDHYNIFLQEQAQAGDWTGVFSLRADRHPLVSLDKTLSPQGALIWRVAPSSALRLSAGTAFRTPNFMESYLDFEQYTGSDAVYVHTLGNTELVPERMQTFEVGFHDESSDYHAVDVVGYVNLLQSEVYISSMTPLVEPYHSESSGFVAGQNGFENLSHEYTALGLEAEGRLYPLTGLDLSGSLAVQQTQVEDGGVVETDKSTSTFKANLGASYRTRLNTDLSINLHYLSAQVWGLPGFDAQGNLVIDEQEIPARTILSARVGVRPLEDKRVVVALSGWNLIPLLGGDAFQEHPKGQLVDSRLFATLSLDL